jgi:hypothetical protein
MTQTTRPSILAAVTPQGSQPKPTQSVADLLRGRRNG